MVLVIPEPEISLVTDTSFFCGRLTSVFFKLAMRREKGGGGGAEKVGRGVFLVNVIFPWS